MLTSNIQGRDSLAEEIRREWESSTPRRISLSGLGGVGKTELSISIIEKLGPIRYVLWLRASDDEILEQDLETAALDLRNELLRFESGNQRAMDEGQAAAAFYFSGVSVSDLVSILKRWLRVPPSDGSRILVVLDDLDGLESSHHEKYSFTFSGDALDLMYTTRDPSMADPGMLWPAVKFDVPSLQADDAADALEQLLTDSRGTREQASRNSVPNASGLELDTTRKAQMREIAARLGALPVAITIGSHYIRDHLGSNWNPDSYMKFLNLWDQKGARATVLNSRRARLKYRHSMFASYLLSFDRLRRNTKDVFGQNKIEEKCRILLQLFSAMDLDEISQNDLSKFKSSFGTAWYALQGNVRQAEFSDIEPDPSRLTHGVYIDECVTELKRVSLLTERLEDGCLLLNNVTKACALSVAANYNPSELVALEHNAKEIWKHWNRTDVKPIDELHVQAMEKDHTDAPTTSANALSE